MHPTQNHPVATPVIDATKRVGTPEPTNNRSALTTPKPFIRNRPLGTPPFARTRPSTADPDEATLKKRRVSTTQEADDRDKGCEIRDPYASATPVHKAKEPEVEPAYDERESIGYVDPGTFASNMISTRVQDMLARLQGCLYTSTHPDSPSAEQNERMDIILDLLISINEAGNNIPMMKRVLLQKMRTLSHDRPFQHALFQVYNACTCSQSQTLRLASPSPRLSSSL